MTNATNAIHLSTIGPHALALCVSPLGLVALGLLSHLPIIFDISGHLLSKLVQTSTPSLLATPIFDCTIFYRKFHLARNICARVPNSSHYALLTSSLILPVIYRSTDNRASHLMRTKCSKPWSPRVSALAIVPEHVCPF